MYINNIYIIYNIMLKLTLRIICKEWRALKTS